MNLKMVILCLQYFGSLFTGKKYPLKTASIIKENEVKLEIDTGEFILHYFTLKKGGGSTLSDFFGKSHKESILKQLFTG